MAQREYIKPLWMHQEDEESQMEEIRLCVERAKQPVEEEDEEDDDDYDDEGEPTRPPTATTDAASTTFNTDASGYSTNASSVSTSQPRGSEGGQRTEAGQQPTPRPGLTPTEAFHKNSIDLLKTVFDVEPHLGLLQSVPELPAGGGITSHVPRIARCLSLIFKATENSKCTVNCTAGPQKFVINVNNIVRGFNSTVFEFKDGEQAGLILNGMRINFQWTDKRYNSTSFDGNRYILYTNNINDMYGIILCWVCLLKNIKPKFMTDVNYPDPIMAFGELTPSLYKECNSLAEERPTVSTVDVLNIWAIRSAL